jgi:hypothetical protein
MNKRGRIFKTRRKSTKCHAQVYTFLIINLNVNGLNIPFERYTLAEWIKKIVRPNNMLPKIKLLNSKDTHRLKVKGRIKERS